MSYSAQDKLSLQCLVGGVGYSALECHSHTTISGLSRHHLDIFIPADMAASALLNQSVHLHYERYQESGDIAGVVQSVNIVGLNQQNDDVIVRLMVESILAPLEHSGGLFIYPYHTVTDVIDAVLQRNGINGYQWQWHLEQRYLTKSYWMQSNDEADLAFLQRVLASSGIFYFSTINSEGDEQIWFTDNLAYVPSFNASIPYRPLRSITHKADQQAHIIEWHLNEKGITPTVRWFDDDLEKNNPTVMTIASASTNTINVEQHYYGQAGSTINSILDHAQYHQTSYQAQQQSAMAKTNVLGLMAGMTIYVEADNVASAITGSYWITDCEYALTIRDHYTDAQIKYIDDIQTLSQANVENKLRLIPANTFYKATMSSLPNTAHFMTAIVESQHDKPFLDASGSVPVRLDWDPELKPATQAMPALPRLQPSLSVNPLTDERVGMHLPLYPDATVLVNYYQGDPERAYLIGAVATDAHVSPVNSHNRFEHRLQTAEGHQWRLNDDAQHSEHSFLSVKKDSGIQLTQQGDVAGILFKTDAGHVMTNAKQQVTVTGDKDGIESAQQDRQINVNDNWCVNADHIVEQTPQQLDYRVKQSAEQQATTLIHTSDSLYQLSASNTARYVAQAADIQWQTQQADLNIVADKTISMTGNGQGDIWLGNAQSGIQITAQGDIHLVGQNINISGDTIQYQGNVTENDSGAAAAAPTLAAIQSQTPPTGITVNADATHQLTRNQLQIQFKTSDGIPFSALENVACRVVSIDGDTTTSFTGAIQQQTLTIHHIDVSKPWALYLGTDINHLAMFAIAVQDKPCRATRWVYADAGQYPTTTLLQDNINVHIQTVSVMVLRLPSHMNYRLYNMAHLQQLGQPALASTFNTPALRQKIMQLWQQAQLAAGDFKDVAPLGDPYVRAELTNEEIAAIKANGNNVTLFIHGYDVAYGEYANDFTYKEEKSPNVNYATLAKTPTISGFNEDKVSLFRDPKNKWILNYTDNPEYDVLPYTPELNGSESHQWWSAMSHNLNQATGKFDGSDYSKYAHIIGLAWQGDPNNPANFMSDMTTAKASAPLVGHLIAQLHANGIEVNVIAHSMGNVVLLQTMQLLAEAGKHNSIQHAFMWEAAVPNFALSNKQHPDDTEGKWYFPNATDAAKTITVLYSQNDNVLGPIPSKNENQLEIDIAKLNQQARTELITAYLLKWIGEAENANSLGDVYDFATWVGVPIMQLTDAVQLGSIYQSWIKDHPYDYNGRHYPVTLAEAAEQYTPLSAQLNRVAHQIHEKLTNLGADTKQTPAETLLNWISVGEFILNNERWMIKTPTDRLLTLALDQVSMVNWYKQLKTLLMIMFETNQEREGFALGYNGPDLSDQYIENMVSNQKIILCNQTKWLWSHSGMRFPSKILMENVYQNYIIGGEYGQKKYGKNSV